MQKFKVTIKGYGLGLLQNKPPQYTFGDPLKVFNPNTDEEKNMLECLYIHNDKICQPATHIWRSLVNAGKDLKVKGKGKATYSKLFGSMTTIEPAMIEHKYQKFEPMSSLIVNPNTKGRMLKMRPLLKKWQLTFYLTAEDEIPEAVIKEGLERSGKYCGIGDWRPEKKGAYGKFMVTEFIAMK